MKFPESLQARYRPLGVLGRGAMGAVYAAVDQRLGRRVAVKVLLRPPGESELLRFRREAQGLAGLRHPHVMEVYDFGVAPEGPYLVTEFLEGASLDHPPEGLSLPGLARSCASALEALHGRGLIHRDVKPANLFWTREGRVVLTDFGLVLDPGRTRLTETGVAVGTPAYLAPECMRGEPGGESQDWWALGVTLFHLAEGRYPFELAAVLAALRGASLPPPVFRRLSPGEPLRSAIEALLDFDPDRRAGSSEELEDCLSGRSNPGGTNPVGPGDAPSSPGPRPGSAEAPLEASPEGPAPGRIWGLGGGLLLGGLLLVLLLARGEDPAGPPTPLPDPEPVSSADVSERPEILGPGALARMKREYSQLEDLYIRSDGTELRLPVPPEPGRARAVLDPDPLHLRELRERLPTLSAVFRWFQGGGDWRDLDAEQVESAAAIDDFLVGQMHPPAFQVLSQAVPVPEGEVPELPEWRGLVEEPPQLHGWVGRAYLAYRTSGQLQAELEASWKTLGSPRPDPGLPSEIFSFSTFSMSSFGRCLVMLRRLPRARGELYRWMAPAVDQTRLMLLCMARGLDRETEGREWLLRSCETMLQQHRYFFPLDLANQAPEALLERTPRSPEQWYLLGLVQARARPLREGVLPPGEELGRGGLESLERAWESVGRDRSHLRMLIGRARIEELASQHLWEEIPRIYSEIAEGLDREASTSVRRMTLLRVLQSWMKGGRELTEEEVRRFDQAVAEATGEGTPRGRNLRDRFGAYCDERRGREPSFRFVSRFETGS